MKTQRSVGKLEGEKGPVLKVSVSMLSYSNHLHTGMQLTLNVLLKSCNNGKFTMVREYTNEASVMTAMYINHTHDVP